MIAILSDVHANLEALQAVYRDLRERGVERTFFLGDIVGYGPDPNAVLDFIQDFEFCLLGNHDEAVLQGPPVTFNPLAQRATWWTRAQICPSEMSAAFLRRGEHERRKKYWTYLLSLKPVRTVGETMFVHDDPSRPGSWRYLLKGENVQRAFRAKPEIRAFFVGHSHLPAVWSEDNMTIPETGQKFEFNRRLLINVGSVGQPRDKDPRACYVILEPDGFRFFRVPYDIEKTQQKIIENPELDSFLAERLEKGI
jgi:diadenosine tetraphosphatase ApaH/serine/threonine PP2A family protein phosphatase